MQQQQQQPKGGQVPVVMRVPPKPKQYVSSVQQQQQTQQLDLNLSGSDTDVSTSNENLTKEERYVIKHMARVEPQGQENLQSGKATPVGDASQVRYATDNSPLRFSSNTSSDSTTRYATPTSNRSISETRGVANPNSVTYASNSDSNRSSLIATPGSNRNSLKETNSNRSSMDVSQSSYNTLIIHDDTNYCEYSSPPPPSYNNMAKKDRPRSYGEQQMQEITEIPEEYLNQSHVLKHLAKEVKLPRNGSESHTRDSGVSEIVSDAREHPPRYHGKRNTHSAGGASSSEQTICSGNCKLRSKSQPDLTRLGEIDFEDVEALIKENQLLKQQLSVAHMKITKTQKLQQEIAHIQHEYEELVQSNDRRERLEAVQRTRFQNELRHAQDMNRALRDQIEALQNQLVSLPNSHQLGRSQQDALIAQLLAQNKELADANKRQYIELQAQHATLQEQRVSINVLENALKRMEEENRQKQIYVEQCEQLQRALQSLQSVASTDRHNDRMMMIDAFTSDLENGNTTATEAANLKWQLREKDSQILRLEAECAKLEQDANVKSVAKMAMEKHSQESQERIIAEANKEKLRFLDEAHTTNRKVTELQTKLKLVESRLAEKDAMIRALQGQKIYGSAGSYGSYNFSSDTFGLNPLSYTSQTSFDASNHSFDVTNPTTSLLDPNTYGQNSSSSFSQSGSISTPYTSSYGGQSNPTIYDSYDAQRKSIDDQLKQLDEALLSKVSEMSMLSNSIRSNKLQLKQINSTNSLSRNLIKGQSSIDIGSGQSSSSMSSTPNSSGALKIPSSTELQRKSLSTSCKDRGLCCFPSLTSKKSAQPLLSEESLQLSSNNSEAFLQNLKQLEQRSRSRCILDNAPNNNDPNKPEEMVLLEKQGRCSQKLRNTTAIGNLAQVTQNVGQNMTDISNIGGKKSPSPSSKVPKIVSNLAQNLPAGILPPRKDRGSSLPPSALPRPPRSLKPPRKIEYGRLGSDVPPDLKKRSQTPPTPTNPPVDFEKQFEMKTSSLKRQNFSNREFSPAKNYMEMKENLKFNKPQEYNMLKHRNYGAIYSAKQDSKFGFKPAEFSNPDYTSTRNYQRLEESRKASLLPNPRKVSPMPQPSNSTNTDKNQGKNSRDSLNSANSSGSNTSNTTPCHAKSDSNSSASITYHNMRSQYSPGSGTSLLLPPSSSSNKQTSFMTSAKNKFQSHQVQGNKSSSLPSSSILHAKASASLPPAKPMDMKSQRGHSLARGENKYRIQF
uniref:CSON000332 protein n=1 Tax=Culicoides sonorensis TaxID=179676 RepID=A0A336KWT4_CULSO